MIKIVHLITGLDIGGAESMLSRLVIGMDRQRFLNRVVSLTAPGPLSHGIQKSGIQVHSLLMQRSIPNPLGMWRLTRYLQNERPDILQTWLYHADLLGVLIGKLTKMPVIAWNVRCSEMDMKHYPPLSRLVRYLLIKFSTVPKVVLFNSKAGQQFHEELGYRPCNSYIIPNGIDLDQFFPDQDARTKLRCELGLSNTILLIGLVARFDPMKDHTTFLQAARVVSRSHPHVHFILAGTSIDYQNSELTNSILEWNLKDNVHLLGERKDVRAILSGLDIVSSSSAFGEGFPNIIVEAMACGVPCVVTSVGDSSLIVGKTGRVVPPKNPEALAEAWSELILMKKEERDKLGLAARQRIIEQFDLAKVINRYQQCYEDLVAN